MRRALAAALAVVLLALAAHAAGELTAGVTAGRAWRLWVPSSPRAGAPLVVALHGCWQTPEDFALGTRLNAAAERRGLFVLYPAQDRRDNPYRCWNWFRPDSRSARTGEPAEVLGLARAIQAERGLGDRRLVVVGFSAGAFLAVELACVAPEVVVGVGAAAGGPFACAANAESGILCMRGVGVDGTRAADACLGVTRARRLDLRASLWHGAIDSVVNPSDLTALETMFARVTGAAASTAEPAAGAVHAQYRDARGAPVVDSWLVAGMGHAWSGGDARGTHTFPPGPDATDRMLDFLLAPPLPAR